MATETAAGLLDDLLAARETGGVVRITRRRLERDGARSEGFVVDASPELVLLHRGGRGARWAWDGELHRWSDATRL